MTKPFAKALAQEWQKYGLVWDLHPQVARSWWHMYCGVTFWKDLMAHASIEKAEQVCHCCLNDALVLGLFPLPQ